MKCPKCGNEIGNNTICPYCGYRKYNNGPTIFLQDKGVQEKKKDMNEVTKLLIIAIILLAGIFVLEIIETAVLLF